MAYGVVGYLSHSTSAPFSFKRINIGGGGFSTGIDVSPDGLTILTRVDVFGSYIWNSGTGKHDLLTTTSRLPAGAGGGGGIEIVSAPSQSSTIYFWNNDGKLYRSMDRGLSFVQLVNFGTHDTNAANGGALVSFNGRLYGPRMAVDPANPDVIYIGTADGGVFTSSNATTTTPTFSSVATVPTSNQLSYTIAFDPRVSQRTSGKSNICYIMSGGHGVYQMTSAGGTFSQVASTPTTAFSNMVVSPNGVLYGAQTDGTFAIGVVKLASGTWTNLTGISIGAITMAVDTTRSGGAAAERVIFSDGSGFLDITSDSGSTWTGILHWNSSVPPLTSPEVPYLATAGATSITASRIVYDPIRDLILLAEGFGNWTAPGSTAANFTWTSQTRGIESMEPQNVVASPAVTGTPTVSAWDLGMWYISNPDTYSATPIGSNQVQSILGGWGVDWTTSTPATLAYLVSFPTGLSNANIAFDASGTSSDGGATFAPMPLSTQSFSVNLTTSAPAAAGTKTLTFGSAIPGWIGRGMVAKNSTHAGTITGYIQSVTSTTITMDRNIGGVGVSSSDSITIGFAGSGQVKAFQTSAGSLSGTNQLTFASLPTDAVHPGMGATNLSNTGTMSSQIAVTSVSGGVVTMDGNHLGAITSGDVILFNEVAWGGAIGATSPNDFIVMPSDGPSFPYKTNDGGASWTPINITGVPRNLFGQTTSGSNIVTVNDTSNLLIGTTFTDISQSAFQNAVVVSITDSTHFVADRNADATFSFNIPFKMRGWGAAHYANWKHIAADRVTPDTSYIYNAETGFVYTSTDKAVTFSIANANAASFNGTVSGNTLTVNSGTPPAVGQRIMELSGKPHVISGTGPFTLDGGSLSIGPIAMTSKVDLVKTFTMNGGLNFTMKSVPLNAGHLFMSNGFSGGSFIRSTNGGSTWSAVSGVSNVLSFGFGKPNVTYPTVFINGTVSGQGTSIFRSDDNCATWVDINGGTNLVLTSLDNIVDLDGDKNTANNLYGAYGSSGFWYLG